MGGFKEGKESRWRWWHTLLLIVLIGAMLYVGFKREFMGFKMGLFEAWIFTMVLLTASLTVIGHGVTGLKKGVLVDDRNMVSLSRLQMVMWTILILSAFITASLSNLAEKECATGSLSNQTAEKDETNKGPLSIRIPEELWILMGISATSLVGSPLVKSTKYQREAHESDKGLAKNQLIKKDIDEKDVDFKGQIVVYTKPEKASFSNIFEGEEAGNAARIDLAKVQMFYFTIILVLAYAVALGKMFASNTFITEFPDLDPSMLWLLGISHGGYLIHKAVPHTRPN